MKYQKLFPIRKLLGPITYGFETLKVSTLDKEAFLLKNRRQTLGSLRSRFQLTDLP